MQGRVGQAGRKHPSRRVRAGSTANSAVKLGSPMPIESGRATMVKAACSQTACASCCSSCWLSRKARSAACRLCAVTRCLVIDSTSLDRTGWTAAGTLSFHVFQSVRQTSTCSRHAGHCHRRCQLAGGVHRCGSAGGVGHLQLRAVPSRRGGCRQVGQLLQAEAAQPTDLTDPGRRVRTLQRERAVVALCVRAERCRHLFVEQAKPAGVGRKTGVAKQQQPARQPEELEWCRLRPCRRPTHSTCIESWRHASAELQRQRAAGSSRGGRAGGPSDSNSASQTGRSARRAASLPSHRRACR